MAVLQTKQFGAVEYQESAVIVFPRGLPGFEQRRRFLALSLPGREPLVFLQNLDDPALCFLTLPVRVVAPDYRLEMAWEDMELIGMRPGPPPRIGDGMLCLVVISVRPEGTTANLLAPLVVNLRSMTGVQAVSPGLRYSHRQPLVPTGGAADRPSTEAMACS